VGRRGPAATAGEGRDRQEGRETERRAARKAARYAVGRNEAPGGPPIDRHLNALTAGKPSSWSAFIEVEVAAASM